MDSESTRQFLAASQLCEEALVEWVTKGIGYPQIFIHKFLTQSEDVFNTINGASFAVNGEVPSDLAEFNVWIGEPPLSHSSANQTAAEMLINIFHMVNDVLKQLGYCDRSPSLQDDHTRAFPDSDAVTIGDWAYAHQHQIAEALGRHFSPPNFQSSCEEAGIDQVEFNRMIARMVRERAAVEKEFLAGGPADDAGLADESVDRKLPDDGCKVEPKDVQAEFREHKKPDGEILSTPYLIDSSEWPFKQSKELTVAYEGGRLTRRIKVGRAFAYLNDELAALWREDSLRE